MSGYAAIAPPVKQQNPPVTRPSGNRHPFILWGVIAAHVAILGIVMTFSAQHSATRPAEKQSEPLEVVMVQLVNEPVNASIVTAPQAGLIPTTPQDKPADIPKPASAPAATPEPALQRSSSTPVAKPQPQAVAPSSAMPTANAPASPSPTVSDRGITEPVAASAASAKTGSHEGNTASASSGRTASASQGGAEHTGAFSPPRFGVAYLNNPPPQYPSIAKRMGEEGKVLLKVLVSPEGSAQEVRLHKSSGSDTLDNAALKAVRKWRFVPAKMGEAALAAWVQVPIVFKLSQGD